MWAVPGQSGGNRQHKSLIPLRKESIVVSDICFLRYMKSPVEGCQLQHHLYLQKPIHPWGPYRGILHSRQKE